MEFVAGQVAPYKKGGHVQFIEAIPSRRRARSCVKTYGRANLRLFASPVPVGNQGRHR